MVDIDILIKALKEKQLHYSGPLSASDWIVILENVKYEINHKPERVEVAKRFADYKLNSSNGHCDCGVCIYYFRRRGVAVPCMLGYSSLEETSDCRKGIMEYFLNHYDEWEEVWTKTDPKPIFRHKEGY